MVSGRAGRQARDGLTWALAALVVLTVFGVRAGEELSDDKLVDDLLGEIKKENRKPLDYAGLRNARLSFVTQWELVQPARTDAKTPKAEWRWKEADGFAAPLTSKPIRSWVEIREAGEYRVYLREVLGPEAAHPVTLTLTPQQVAPADAPARFVDAGAARTQAYGKRPLPRAVNGRELEAELPIRFEDEASRLAPV
jgi:hypothetical protein